MKSKSFTNHDIKNNKTKKKLQLFFIEEYCPQYKDINLFNQTIDNDKLLEQIEKDLNRRLNLFIHDFNSAAADNITNVVESMREKITKDSLSTSDLCQELQSTYRLSLGQANYIAISSTQGGIGGCYPSDIIAKIKPDVTMLINKPGTLSQIIIDEDKYVQYIGGQVILFDQSVEKWSEVLNKSVGIENYLLEKSTDQVILYVTVNLGLLGQDITTRPEVRIDVAGAGKKGHDFIKQLRSIKTKCNNTAAAEIKLNYITLSDFTIYQNKSDERCELALRTEQIWYEIDLTASASSSESLTVEQTIQKSNINACLKTQSTFYVSMDSLQDFVALEGDNTNTNKLSNTFSFLTQCILSSDKLSINQEQESYGVSSDFIPITKLPVEGDSKIVPHVETSVISLGDRVTIQDSNQEEDYSQAQIAKIVKYIMPQEGNRLAIIESISQLEKFLHRGALINKPDINIILYHLNAIHWVTFCITKLPEEVITLYKDSVGNDIPGEIKESITQCFNGYPVRFVVHREQEQNDRSSGGPMAIRNVQIILQGLQQNGEEFIHQFTQTKFCTQQDVAQYKEIFYQLSLSSSHQDLAMALKQDNNSSIIIGKKLLEDTKHLDTYIQKIKKDNDYVAVVKIQNHENFIQRERS